MFLSRAALSFNAISRVPGALQIPQSAGAAVRLLRSPRSSPAVAGGPRYSTASAGSTQPPQRWTSLDPELEDFLVPRKMSMSPLESWLSLRYSLPQQQPPPPGEGPPEGGGESRVLPPAVEPALGGEEEEEEGGAGTAAPLSCKNVLEIRRRKMNRHKYRKLMKRTTFLRKRVMEGRRKRKQVRFERDLKRIWRRAGLRSAPDGWKAPNIYVRQYKSKKD